LIAGDPLLGQVGQHLEDVEVGRAVQGDGAARFGDAGHDYRGAKTPDYRHSEYRTRAGTNHLGIPRIDRPLGRDDSRCADSFCGAHDGAEVTWIGDAVTDDDRPGASGNVVESSLRKPTLGDHPLGGDGIADRGDHVLAGRVKRQALLLDPGRHGVAFEAYDLEDPTSLNGRVNAVRTLGQESS
jgi:hypothetical protein